MASPRPDWLRRLSAGSREIVGAVRPHGADAMFAPTDPVEPRLSAVGGRDTRRAAAPLAPR